jgi:ribosomal protein S18 acetylase RimI-like enzyme
MTDLPENLFANAVWHALQTKHRHFATSAGGACRYPADVAPFAAVAEPTAPALRELLSLLLPGEFVWIIGESHPQESALFVAETMQCLQMVLPEDIAQSDPPSALVRLSVLDVPEMIALTELAFPGFFRKRTIEMGVYYGVRSHGELIAMGGERLMLEGYPEISGVCSHPAHRGKGLGAGIIRQLVQNHRRAGLVSWLHVGVANARAIELYRRLGFKAVRTVELSRVGRAD